MVVARIIVHSCCVSQLDFIADQTFIAKVCKVVEIWNPLVAYTPGKILMPGTLMCTHTRARANTFFSSMAVLVPWGEIIMEK